MDDNFERLEGDEDQYISRILIKDLKSIVKPELELVGSNRNEIRLQVKNLNKNLI